MKYNKCWLQFYIKKMQKKRERLILNFWHAVYPDAKNAANPLQLFTVFVFTTIVLNNVFRFNYSSMEENLMDMIFNCINSFVIFIKALFLIYCLVRSVYLISKSGRFCSSLCFGNTTHSGSKIKSNVYL